MSTEYHVTWNIDIDANSPEEAARKALEIQKRPDSTATVFHVVERDGDDDEEITVDLSEEEGENPEPTTPITRAELIHKLCDYRFDHFDNDLTMEAIMHGRTGYAEMPNAELEQVAYEEGLGHFTISDPCPIQWPNVGRVAFDLRAYDVTAPLYGAVRETDGSDHAYAFGIEQTSAGLFLVVDKSRPINLEEPDKTKRPMLPIVWTDGLREVGEDEAPWGKLLGTVEIAGVPHHIEAWAVREVNDDGAMVQEAVDPHTSYDAIVDHMVEGAGQTVIINDREYFMVVTPFQA